MESRSSPNTLFNDETIFETIKIDPSPEIRKELSAWIKYCSSLNKHAIEAVRPGTSEKGPLDLGIEDIMRYQNIAQDGFDIIFLLIRRK